MHDETLDDVLDTLTSEDGPEPFLCPITQSVVDPQDTDKIIETLHLIRETIARLRCDAIRCEQMLLDKLGPVDSRTARVYGEKSAVIVQQPSEKWDQATLKKVAQTFPEFAERVVKPASYRVQLREWKKLQAAALPPKMQQAKELLQSAYLGRQGTPSIKVELLNGEKLI